MVRRRFERVEDALRESPGLVPGLVVLAVMFWWAAQDGGFSPLIWLPGSLILIALTLVYVLAAPGRYRGGTALAVAMISFVAFAVWSFLSITWSDTPAFAWSGSNLTLTYLVVFVLFAWRTWTPAAAAVVLGAYSLGIAAIGLATMERAATSATPLDFFIAGRLASPIAYSNANCALLISAALPSLFLASRREVHWLLRGLFLASIGVLAELALMSQSRASLVAVPATLAVFLIFVPGRTRIVLMLIPVVAIVVGIGIRPVLDTYKGVVSGTDLATVLGDARVAILTTVVLLLAAGAVVGLVDRAVMVSPRVALASGAILLVLGIAGLAVVSTAFVNRYDPVANASTWWDRFSGGSYLYEAATPHLVSGLGSGRYDIWRVAFDVFKRDSITGAGVDTFGADYLRQRTRLDDPVYPHSIELRTLEGTGLIGTFLLLSTFLAAGVAAVRAARGGSGFGRGIIVTALAFVAYWLIHGSVDWFWEMPVLGATAFACLGLATSVRSVHSAEPSPGNLRDPEWDLAGDAEPDSRAVAAPASRPRTHIRAVLVPALVLTVLAASISLALPWLSARDVRVATRGWASDPSGAFARLDRARSLNPLSDEPDIYAGIIAAQLGDVSRQRASFERAIERNPRNWYSRLELGALDAREGRRALGLRRLEQARRLDPLEPTITAVIERVKSGKPPSEAVIEAMLVDRVDLLTGKRQG